jgi:DNA-binding LytR/AlgR family response regulator
MGHIENSGIRAEISCFADSDAFLRSFRAERYDIIFMDIYMRDDTGATDAAGIKTAEKIRKVDKNVTLVFTTSSIDHTLESYRLQAIKYLEKPLNAEAVKEALEFTFIKRKTRKTITIAVTGGKNMEVPLDDIIFFEHKDHVVTVHTTASGVLRTSQSARLDALEKRLPSPPFIRCHRSYIVNLDYVQKIDASTHSFTMVNGGRADINQKRKLGELEEILQIWLTEKARGLE